MPDTEKTPKTPASDASTAPPIGAANANGAGNGNVAGAGGPVKVEVSSKAVSSHAASPIPSPTGGAGDPPANLPPDGTGAGGDGAGNIADVQIERELQDSYLTYAMSTIMDRALPDVRDGLKPSQRRILFAMHQLNLRPGKKHIKCAKICGDTSGNYHPHGDAVIYPTLVIMGQSWRMRGTLVDPQGNFGSIAPDPPAAMRYTEARLTQSAVDMLDDLGYGTVNFQPNFDDRPGFDEPTVLPAKFPNLLVNGGVGIAVGMATSLAPHNPVEVFDAIIRTLENPEIALGELMTDVLDEAGNVVRRGIKGPDFPTGGVILGRQGIIDAYATGRGRVSIRGKVRVEPLEGSKDRQQIVVEQIPYNLGLKTFIENIQDAIEGEKITDISDARDESSAKSPVRVVIELKRGADAGVVEKQLYQFTPLQQTFSIHNIALVNRQPRTLSLGELIKYYIEHRMTVIRRRTAYLLNEARQRAHKIEGQIYAVCDIDAVVKLIRSSSTKSEAIERLMTHKFRIAGSPLMDKLPARLQEMVRRSPDGLTLSRVQAETICDMRLSQLVGLEIERLAQTYRELIAQIEDYEDILAKPERVRAMIKADCEQMRARFTSTKLSGANSIDGRVYLGDRCTEIQDGGDGAAIDIGALIQVEDMAVTISNQGYAKRVVLSTYRQQGRGGKGIIGGATKDEEDFIEHMFVASTHDDLLCFTNTGRVFKIKVYELPELPRTSKGRSIVNLIELKEGEKVRAFLNIKDFEAGSHYLTFVSRQGIVKRTPLKDYRNVNKSGLIAVGLKEGVDGAKPDEILDVLETTGNDDVLLATASGMSIRFDEADARVMGRPAAGVKGIELSEGDEVIGAVRVAMKRNPDETTTTIDPTLALLTISENGYGKRTLIDEYRVAPETGPMRSQSRGGKGRVDIDASERNGKSVAALGVMPTDDVVVTTKSGMTVRMPVSEIRETGRGTQGVRVTKLDDGDTVVAAARVASED
jgi:DNA gyrase subunit A